MIQRMDNHLIHVILLYIVLLLIKFSESYLHYDALQEFFRPEKFRVILPNIPKVNPAYNISHSTESAWYYLHNQSIESTHNRLAIMIGFSYVFEYPLAKFDDERLHYLHCSLHKFYTNIGKFTPIDVYLWVSWDERSQLPSWLKEDYPQLIILPIQESSWQIPANVGPHSSWKHSTQFAVDYYLHSRWRMTFAMEFVKAMGYPYVLLTDDDTFVLNEISQNVIDRLLEHDILLATRQRHMIEKPEYVTGLPEFTRYWMTIRNLVEPPGTLFEHLNPPSLQGMTTAGWDRHVYSGCFTIINVDFWFLPVVQDYIHFVMKSGGDIEQRWTEQAVQNMVTLMFVPKRNLYIIPSDVIRIPHGKPGKPFLQHLQCPNTVERLLLPYQQHSIVDEENVDESDDYDDESTEEVAQEEHVIQTIVFVEGYYPLEIADFNWHCREHEAIIGIPCSVNPYASLPYYIDAFCVRFGIAHSFCEVLRDHVMAKIPLTSSVVARNDQ